jgi:hypothetical protein
MTSMITMNRAAKISIVMAIVGALAALGELWQIYERSSQRGPKGEMAMGDGIAFLEIVLPTLVVGFGTAAFAGKFRWRLLLIHLLLLVSLAAVFFRIGR